jgi:Ca-activated chloride channel family protein
MTFIWPELLWLLLAVPLLVGLYLLLLRRKKKAALAYASLSMVKAAMRPGQRFRRHVPPLLFLLSLIAMIVAVARPAAIVTLPSQRETIILAMDVSGSMRATDVQPNRLAAAQAAARAFVAEQPAKARIGVVSFAATASVVQPPTENREDILAAIDRFQLQRGTAVGSGILVAQDDLPRRGVRSALVESARRQRARSPPGCPPRFAARSGQGQGRSQAG